jgi:hypothetical protein
MADNINDDTLNKPLNPQSENISDEIIFTNDTDVLTANIETENMEVHHHPDLHHKPKKWKEYLLEGLMIFIAVMMGFIAESYREHLANKEIEKRNIESFIVNVQKDSANLTNSIKFCQNKNMIIDSLSILPGEFTDTSFQKHFFDYVIKLFYTDNYLPDESAFLQMQSSNTLRLIQKQNITDSILKYHAVNSEILYQQGYVIKIFNSALDNIIETTDFRKYPNVKFNGNYQQVQNYINYKLGERNATENYIGMLKQQLFNATHLIPFLKKEYDIE